VAAALLPVVGNGFIATQVGDDSFFVAGIYNGKTVGNAFGPCHRAALPSDVGALATVPPPGVPADAALDVRRAVYFRRSWLDPSPRCSAASNESCATAALGARAWVEQRFYAHRDLPSVFVAEVQLFADDGAGGVDDGAGGTGDGASYGAGARGTRSGPGARGTDTPVAFLRLAPTPSFAPTDVNLTVVSPPASAVVARAGWTQIAETPETPLQGVAVVATNATSADTPAGLWAVPALGATLTFLTVVRTTIETAGGLDALVAAAQYDLAAAAAMAANGSLFQTHVDAWARDVWTAGVEVAGRPDVARAANSSLYAIFSSARADRAFGLSPGGLTAGYYGHVFWDQGR
jgi:hypothetical protein